MDVSALTSRLQARGISRPGLRGRAGFLCFGFDAHDLAGHTASGFRWTTPSHGISIHHAILFADSTNYPDGPVSCLDNPVGPGEGLHVWAPGGDAYELPQGVGLGVPDNTQRLVVQTHVLRLAAGPPGRVSVAICAVDAAVDHVAAWIKGKAPVPKIEPQSSVTSTAKCRMNAAASLVGVWPHMHRAGTVFQGDLFPAESSSKHIVSVDPWDFGDQRIHPIAIAIDVDVDDAIQTSCTWQNTTTHPIVGGILTSQEMCEQGFIAYPLGVECVPAK